jgi:UDP-N-acetylmuramyl pentapeptide phosphotransferase/UDP-N-acetylglucosamine-1-phosphate transferase
MERGANGVAAAQLALAGACVGFLPYNFPKARIFLGDAGSLFLGYALGASALIAVNDAAPGWGRVGPVLLLAYPAFDMVFSIITRMRDRHPIYLGGKDHTNHRLAKLVGTPARTVMLIWVGAAALCASGLAVLVIDRPTVTLAIAGAWVAALLAAGVRLAGVAVVRQGS